ncbi:MAG: hypothetical protein OER04_00285 [Cyclobacteriaceae bacterium]|nr:hypothetical protein [Cyclobacteriaceae bacterium]
MYRTVISELVRYSKSSDTGPCVSILLPLHQTLPQRNKNPLSLKRALNEAKVQLKKYPSTETQVITKELDRLAKEIDFKKTDQALGIFVGKKFSRLIDFPFQITQKVVVDNSFETRDLTYGIQYLTDYWVLTLNPKAVRLFKAQGHSLHEILEDPFPIEYQEQYQYPDRQKPRISGDYQREESQIKDERRLQFLRHVNKLASPYFKQDPLPIAIMGIKDLQVLFSKIFDYDAQVVKRLYGDFKNWSVQKIAKAAWEQIQDHVYQSTDQLLEEIRESKGKRAYLYGIEAVWRVAQEGRGDKLIVEKDYQAPAYADPQTGKLYFNLTYTTGLLKKVDAVDDVIELIRDKHGEIVFMENGKLEEYEHIAVKTRY